MSRKKPEPPEPAHEQVIIEKVDAMMDIKRPDPVPASSANSAAIDIFKDLQTKPPIALTDDAPAEPHASQKSVPDSPQAESPKPALAPVPAAEESDQREASAEPAVLPPLAPSAEDTDYDDAATDKAVEDVVRAESDALLAAEDIVAKVTPPVPPPKPKKSRFRLF